MKLYNIMQRITGGSIKASTVQEMIKASYNDNKGYDTIGEYNKDKSLSNNEVLCYYTLPPRTDPQAVAVFRGTEGTMTDWSNNAKYAVGAYDTTDRLKRATDAFNRIIAKYGRANTSLIGHSQSAVITRKLGQGAKEVINLNGANLGEKSLDNEYNVRSSTDVVSQVKPIADVYNKVQDTKKNALKSVANVFLPKKQQFKMAKDTSNQNITIKGGYNPVEEHMPGIIDRIDPNKPIGKGIMGYGFDTSMITSGQVIRTPLSEKIMETINQSTAGMLRERLKTTSYDKLYHLRIDFSTADGVITIEKNYGSIDTLHNDTRDLTSESERMDIGPVPKGLTVGQVLDNTRKAMGSSYSSYNGLTNNCQDFIISILSANRLGNSRVNSFVKQNLYELIEPELKMVAKEGAKQAIHEGLKTEQGQQLKQQAEEYINKNMPEQGHQARDLINSHLQSITGEGLGDNEVLQSVIFKRPKWTLNKAENWLKKHKYKHIVDVKPEHYRFRQEDPKELEHKGYHYITKDAGKGIQLIIGILNERNKSAETKDNKEMINKIHNIIMPYRKHQAESESDSESDEEMQGAGVRHEEEIIRKIDNLADRIHEHQKIHGGKIHIAKAFKDLGHTIKKGFNEDVNDIKRGSKEAGHYITSKNGLADDLTNYAIPATLGAIGGVAGEMVGGPAGGVAGSMLGTYAGDKLAGQIDKSGHMDTRGDSMKAMGGRIRGRGMYDNLTMADMHKIKAMNDEMELRENHKKRNIDLIAKAEIARRKRELKEHHKNEEKELKKKLKGSIKARGSGLTDEPLEAQNQAPPALQQEIKRKRGRPAGTGILKKISKKITIRPKVGVDAQGNFSVSPDVGYKVGDKMEVHKDGLHYNLYDNGIGHNTGRGGKLHFKPLSQAPSLLYHQVVDGTKNEMRGGVGGILGGKYANGDFGNAPTQDASYGRGIYHDAKHFITEGTTNKNKKKSKSAGIILLNGMDAIYNTGVQDMPEKFSHLNDGRSGYTEGFGISGGKFSFKKMGERVDNGENVFTDYGKSKQGKANNKATVNALKTGGIALAVGVGKGVRGRGRPKKIDVGDLVHIDIDSHNEKVKGGLIRRDMSAAVMPPDAISPDAIRPIGMPKPRGLGFKKGSQEAKDHMARIRAMRKK